MDLVPEGIVIKKTDCERVKSRKEDENNDQQ
jgi:hypothetical protein